MNRSRILVVDDEANARGALVELLCDAGYEVAVAASGDEALKLVDSFHPHVLLTDARMRATRERSGSPADCAAARPR
jgi:CheY-like chemotaxis protein